MKTWLILQTDDQRKTISTSAFKSNNGKFHSHLSKYVSKDI